MDYNYLYLVILIVFSWVFIILSLAPKINKTKHFATMGPALMIRATKNRGTLDAVSKRLPAKTIGKISTVLVILGGLTAFIMLLYEAILITVVPIPSGAAPSPLEDLAIPVINPFIPLGYGTATLVFAVVIHEMFHGIVARKHGIKVNSVGALFFVIPVGAFVEPDEKEIMAADPVVRRRIIAAGPGINLIIAVICILLLVFVMMPASTPIHNGIYVESSTAIDPVHGHTIPKSYEIIKYGNISGNALNNLETTSNLTPGMENVELFNGKTYVNESVPTGVVISDLISGFPAAAHNVSINSIIYKINNKTVYNINTLGSILNNITPGKNVTMETMSFGSSVHYHNYTMKTVSTYSYYAKNAPTANKNAYKSESFIGVGITYSGIGYEPISYMHSLVFGGLLAGSGFYETLGLPILGLSPIPTALSGLFATPFNSYIFFGIVNTLYWLFWFDFLLGIFNALPLSILDGGQYFKDSLAIASRRKHLSFLKDQQNITKIYYIIGMFVFMLLMYIIIIPYVHL